MCQHDTCVILLQNHLKYQIVFFLSNNCVLMTQLFFLLFFQVLRKKMLRYWNIKAKEVLMEDTILGINIAFSILKHDKNARTASAE